MKRKSSKINEAEIFTYLVSTGQISARDLEKAKLDERTASVGLETVLVDDYRVSKAEIGKALSAYYHCPYLEFNERVLPDPALIKNLNIDYLMKNHWIPLRLDDNSLDVLIDDPSDLVKGLDIKRTFPGRVIRFAVGSRQDIQQFLLAASGQSERGSIGDLLGELANEANVAQKELAAPELVDEHHSSIVRLANQIIAEGIRADASDIHIEPFTDKKETSVRFRVDGSCSTYMKIPAFYRRAIVSRFKIMANLDISERRKPQDGKIQFQLGKDAFVELRVATIPTSGSNEDVVMRILSSKGPMPLEQLELLDEDLQKFKRLAEQPYGIILCVGPTGSGKTTTLHSLLGYINTDERKIWTAEDPIEITQEGLRQVQVHPKIGLTFASAMRSFLRADPDVIMIGEMRDQETADIAIECSLTGHLVLSTLHTNSAVETITRLLDLGCDSFNFADAMLGIVAKRLCKRICIKCRQAYSPSEKEYVELVRAYGPDYWKNLNIEYDESFTLYRGLGCEACNFTGFKGRIALHELLIGTEEMKTKIQAKARTKELLKLAMEEGMTTLIQDGIQKVLRGDTTFKQVRRVAIK